MNHDIVIRMPPRPAEGYPWEQPGFTFVTGWPYGYVPRAADEQLASSWKAKAAENERKGVRKEKY